MSVSWHVYNHLVQKTLLMLCMERCWNQDPNWACQTLKQCFFVTLSTSNFTKPKQRNLSFNTEPYLSSFLFSPLKILISYIIICSVLLIDNKALQNICGSSLSLFISGMDCCFWLTSQQSQNHKDRSKYGLQIPNNFLEFLLSSVTQWFELTTHIQFTKTKPT